MSEIIYEDRMGQLENDTYYRIATYVDNRYAMDFHASTYTKEGRRAAAAVFWADYFESDKDL